MIKTYRYVTGITYFWRPMIGGKSEKHLANTIVDCQRNRNQSGLERRSDRTAVPYYSAQSR